MHFYCSNDAVPWLNKAKSRIFRCTVNFKNPNSPVFRLPPAVRPDSATCTGPIFLTKNVIGVYNTNPAVVPKKIYPLRYGDSFHLSLAFIVLL